MGCECSRSMVIREKGTDDIRRYYRIGKLLGSGSFGQVRECTHRQSAQVCAVKIMERRTKGKMPGRPSSEQMIKCEVDILRQAHHENIIGFHEFFEDKHFLYVVLEKCDGGELFYHIVRRRQFTEADASVISKQMLAALDYIHSRGIVHRDIKAENFLFKGAYPGSPIKLIDFGMSAIVEEGGSLSDLCGSPHYISPELIRKNYDTKADLWAFGVMIYLMLYGRYPFEGAKPADIAREIVGKDIDWASEDGEDLTPECKDFMKNLLERNPSKRMTAAMALKHPWISQDTASKAETIIPKTLIERARRVSVETERVIPDRATVARRATKLAEVENDYKRGHSTGRRISEPHNFQGPSSSLPL